MPTIPASGWSPSTGTSGSYYRARVDYTESVDVASNSSTVTWYFRIWATQEGSQSQYHYSNGNTVQVTINGSTSTTYPAVDLRGTSQSSPYLLASGTRTIQHDSTTGTATLQVTATYTAPSAATALGSITVNGSAALTTIPRVPAVTGTDANIGSSTTIKWTPNATAHCFRLHLSCGNWSSDVTSIAPNRTTEYSYSYSIPTAVANQITTGNTGALTIVLEAFTDSTYATSMGTSSTSITVTVPSSSTYNPTAGLSVTRINGFGSYNLTNRTTFGVSITATAAASATLSFTFAVTAPNGSVVYTASGTSSTTVSIGPFTAAGTYGLALTVTDSRGRTASTNTTVDVTAYSVPTITGAVTRGTGTGSNFTPDESSGTVARVTYTVSYTNLTGNSLSVGVGKEGETPTTFATQTGVAYVTNCDIATSYTFVISAYDTVLGSSNPVTFTLHLGVAAYPIDFKEDATGMAIHGVATRSGSLQVGWNLDIESGHILRLWDDSGHCRVTLDNINGLVFYNAAGGVDKSYPAS